MPAATQYWSQLTDTQRRALMQEAEEERRQRAEQYRLACDQYDGKHKKFIKRREGTVDPNVIVNLDGEAIDQIVAFAVPDMPTFQSDEVKETPLEKWIVDAWKHNDGAALLQDFMLFGCLSGHVYARLLPPKQGEEYAQIVALNPATCISYWKADDLRTVLWHEICYTTDRRWRIDFVNAAELTGSQQWEIYTYVMQGNAWVQAQEAEVWPYEYPPIVAWQHQRDPRRYYGKSHLLASGLNDAVNKVASDVKQILRYHASPRTIGKGIAAKDVETTSIDSFFTVPKDADVFNLEMNSDLTSSLNFYETLRAAHADEMRVVRMTGGLEAFKGITNFGLRVAFMKMNAQNTQLRRNYERPLIALTRALLAIGGKGSDIPLEMEWPDALPVSELEETQVAQQQHDLGVLSLQTASQRLGLDYEDEQDRLDAEVESDPTPAQQIGQQGQFAGAMVQPMNGRDMPTEGDNGKTPA